jgi:hypothetical protein
MVLSGAVIAVGAAIAPTAIAGVARNGPTVTRTALFRQVALADDNLEFLTLPACEQMPCRDRYRKGVVSG